MIGKIPMFYIKFYKIGESNFFHLYKKKSVQNRENMILFNSTSILSSLLSFKKCLKFIAGLLAAMFIVYTFIEV